MNPLIGPNLTIKSYILSMVFILLSSLSSDLIAISEGPIPEGLSHRTKGIQIPFIENKGQIKHPDISFYTITPIGTVLVLRDGQIGYSLTAKDRDQTQKKGSFLSI